jgi:SAM-dependent methyltransferase
MFPRIEGEISVCPSCRRMPVTHLDFLRDRTTSFISGCPTCGLVFVNPPPSSEEIGTKYAPDGEWETKLTKRSHRIKEPDTTTFDKNRVTFETEAHRLREQYGLRRVLDFGCGNGEVLDHFKKTGWETTGLDPATASGITDHAMINTLPDEPTFDLIIFKHVLEHIINPLTTLRQARRCLNENGYIYVQGPTLDRLPEHGKKRYCVNERFHITAYTRRSLTNQLALAGFVLDREIPHPRLYRMSLLGRAAASPLPINDPLRDARRELRNYAVRQEGWLRGNLPARLRLFLTIRDEDRRAARDVAMKRAKEKRLAAKAAKRRIKERDRSSRQAGG